MIILSQAAFWISLLVILYTYIGYGIVLLFLTTLKAKRPKLEYEKEDLPEITHLIAAYNEEEIIPDKIRNSLGLSYPQSRLHTVIVTDGSTDRTAEIVQSFPEVNHYHSTDRRGKIHAVNRVMKQIHTPLVVFSDANALLNSEAILKIARHYKDPTVGGVAGEKRIATKASDNAAGAGEGLYWKYESLLKQKDSELHSIVGAAGELFSIRTSLFEEPPSNIIIEDFYLSLTIASRGYRFVYEPGATATETASHSVDEEWKRKVRICAGGFQAMQKLSFLLNPLRYGVLTFQYVSHRVLRWTLAPLALALMLITSFYLSFSGLWLYQLFLGLQLLFYGVAWAGYVFQNRNVRIKGFFVPYYFTVMNLSVYAGFMRFIRGRQSVTWEKAKRAQA
jgi:cellulose synthase/poly-beta-1,6-N-acetylglucosamine synthase-like glycosyltransferase